MRDILLNLKKVRICLKQSQKVRRVYKATVVEAAKKISKNLKKSESASKNLKKSESASKNLKKSLFCQKKISKSQTGYQLRYLFATQLSFICPGWVAVAVPFLQHSCPSYDKVGCSCDTFLAPQLSIMMSESQNVAKQSQDGWQMSLCVSEFQL